MGVVGVHGASAVWGLAAVGLFADGELPGIQASEPGRSEEVMTEGGYHHSWFISWKIH